MLEKETTPELSCKDGAVGSHGVIPANSAAMPQSILRDRILRIFALILSREVTQQREQHRLLKSMSDNVHSDLLNLPHVALSAPYQEGHY